MWGTSLLLLAAFSAIMDMIILINESYLFCDFGLRVEGPELGVWGLGFGVWGLGLGVQGAGCRVQGVGFSVEG